MVVQLFIKNFPFLLVEREAYSGGAGGSQDPAFQRVRGGDRRQGLRPASGQAVDPLNAGRQGAFLLKCGSVKEL